MSYPQRFKRKLDLPPSSLEKARERKRLKLVQSLWLEIVVYVPGTYSSDVDWELRNDEGLWAWGELERGNKRYVTRGAEVVEELRGLRIYPTVLKHLRELLGPIRSDIILSRSAEKAWQQTPAKRKTRGRTYYYYMWNPPRGVRYEFNQDIIPELEAKYGKRVPYVLPIILQAIAERGPSSFFSLSEQDGQRVFSFVTSSILRMVDDVYRAAMPTDKLWERKKSPYLPLVLEWLKTGSVTFPEDFEKTRDTIREFNEIKSKGTIKGKDAELKNFTTLQDMQAVVARLRGLGKTLGCSGHGAKIIARERFTTGEELRLYRITTYKAMVRCCSNTSWCVVPKETSFDSFGPPYYLITAATAEGESRVALVHVMSGQVKAPQGPQRPISYDFDSDTYGNRELEEVAVAASAMAKQVTAWLKRLFPEPLWSDRYGDLYRFSGVPLTGGIGYDEDTVQIAANNFFDILEQIADDAVSQSHHADEVIRDSPWVLEQAKKQWLNEHGDEYGDPQDLYEEGDPDFMELYDEIEADELQSYWNNCSDSYLCSLVRLPVYDTTIAMEELTSRITKKATQAIRKTGDGTSNAKETALAVLTMQRFAEEVAHDAPDFTKPLQELL